MRLYKVVEKRVEQRQQDTRTRCDRCGETVGGRRDNRDEVEIKAWLGNVYPEGDCRTVIATDACADCFRDHVVPALEQAGFKFRRYDADGPEPRELDPEVKEKSNDE